MNNHSFENGSIIFSEPHAQAALLRKVLERTPVLTGVHVLSLSSYLRNAGIAAMDSQTVFCETAKICASMNGEMEILGEMLKYPQTIKELADFVLELDEYGVECSKLPEDSSKERDIKKLALKVDMIGLPGKAIRRLFDLLLLNTKNKPIYLSSSDESLVTSMRYEDLLAAGAIRLKFENYDSIPKLYHAVNARMEALGIAQFIANDPLPFFQQVLVCLDPIANLPVLKANFDRLGIPYTILSESHVLPEADLFIKLLSFCENKSMDYWLDVLNTSIMNSSYPLVSYIEDFGIDLDPLLRPLDHVACALVDNVLWDSTHEETYLEMEKRAEIIRKETANILDGALKISLANWKSGVEAVYELCLGRCTMSDEGKTAILQIKSVLEKSIPLLEALPNASDLLLFSLQGLRTKTKPAINGVIITDLNHFHIPGMKRMFVVSSSQKNFPQFEPKNGLIDDSYREKTGLPLVKEQYMHHMKRIQDLFTWTPEVVFSYATGNYEGKSNELSFEIELFCQSKGVTPVKWPIIEQVGRQKMEPVLTPETMKALLFPKGTMGGSISTIERFFECPYKYFLSTVLNLRTKPAAKIETSVIGTLMHEIFEKAINAYHKDYPTISDDEIKTLSNPYFRDLQRMYPQHFNTIATLEERLMAQLRKVFDRMVIIESESSFIPKETEHKFIRNVSIHPEIQLSLRGYIDRIDTTSTQLRVIDYKSSAKKLNLKKVLTGQQLQLLTYLWIASQDFDLEAAGAYYISLKQENTSVSAGKLGLRPAKIEEYGESEWGDAAWKIHRLKGWTFSDPVSLDLNGKNIDSLKIDKDGKVVVVGGPYRIDLVEQLMHELYAYFGSQLILGDISRICTAHACDYCDFVRLCQFRGDTLNVKTRTSVKDLKKGDTVK